MNFTKIDTYRGMNVNMHPVEAFTAAFDKTGEAKYLERALAICKRTVDGFAREHNWLLPELQVVEATWPGKPEAYHAFNACVLPLLPFRSSFIGAVKKTNY